MGNNVLEQISVTIGILIDENLTWKNHITFVPNKIAKYWKHQKNET